MQGFVVVCAELLPFFSLLVLLLSTKLFPASH